MREIKFIGNTKRGNDNRNYSYSLFLCPCCGNQVEKKTRDGLKARFCSHKCYAIKRGLRGAYKNSVFISGYNYIYSPDHPNKTRHNYVAEHRLVAERKIGRYLTIDEDVHHIDGVKLNNHPDNLIVLNKSDHIKLHLNQRKRNNYGQFKI